ncbi:fibronectin type III domain-containing protein [Cellulomonas soli]|uniref:fibronectin type III domain-containing protein n=1 Tax=Cellulomonas soli TaxID=931535 RepID=UPI003F84D7B2
MSPTEVVFDGSRWLPLNGRPIGGSTPPANAAPSAPGALVATPSATSVVLSWSAATDGDGTVAGYQVRVNGTLVATVTSLSHTVTGLTSGVTVALAVAAVDDDGAVGPAATASVTTDVVTVAHGREISEVNTGHTAYFDASLGRTLTDADLVVHTALVSMSDLVADGGTISKRDFRGGLIPDRAGVTLVACRIPFINNASTSRAFVARWCTFDTGTGAASDHAVGSWSYELFRCRLGGSSDGLRTNGDVIATECFVRVKGQGPDDHNDGAQNFGGGGTVVLRRSNFDVRPTNGVGAPNAALFCADGATGMQTWHDNLLAGGGYVMRMYGDAAVPDGLSFDVQGNDIVQDSWVFGPVHRAVVGPEDVTWGTERPNRIVTAAGVFVATIPAP